jgi:hypothetical protein
MTAFVSFSNFCNFRQEFLVAALPRYSLPNSYALT